MPPRAAHEVRRNGAALAKLISEVVLPSATRAR
jgi:hypothetical protein